MTARRLDGSALKAIVFDVDGTLYHQGPLRRWMTWRLLRQHAMQPGHGLRTLRALRAYRQAQEGLRGGRSRLDLADAQIRVACGRTDLPHEFVAECVERWIGLEPLTLLPRCVRAGVVEFLNTCRARGLRLAAVSDYPAVEKLEALGFRALFDVVVCAYAPDVGVFKPDPRGLHVALQRLGTAASDSLYVGDRPEVDAVAATAAGMRCAILTRGRRIATDVAWLPVAGYAELQALLFP